MSSSILWGRVYIIMIFGIGIFEGGSKRGGVKCCIDSRWLLEGITLHHWLHMWQNIVTNIYMFSVILIAHDVLPLLISNQMRYESLL